MGDIRRMLTLVKEKIDKFINVVVITLIALIIIVVFIQVFSRYVLNNPLTWSEELARYLFIWITFLASVVVFRENGHMSVDFIVTLFPHKIRVLVDLIGKAIITIFLITILYVSPNIITITFKQLSPTLSVPMGVIYLAFPVSLGLMLLELIFRILLFDPNAIKKVGGQ